jgi:hypothetical protein
MRKDDPHLREASAGQTIFRSLLQDERESDQRHNPKADKKEPEDDTRLLFSPRAF